MKLPLPIDMYLKVSSRFYFCRRWTVAVLAVFGLLMAARLALCVLNLPEDFAMEVAKYPVVQANPDLDPFELVETVKIMLMTSALILLIHGLLGLWAVWLENTALASVYAIGCIFIFIFTQIFAVVVGSFEIFTFTIAFLCSMVSVSFAYDLHYFQYQRDQEKV